MNSQKISLRAAQSDEQTSAGSPLPKTADVVVVGAGLSGMTTAALLTQAGKHVTVIENRPTIGAGDTGQTTAHITQLFDSGYAAIVKNFGQDQANLVARGLSAAIDTVEKLVRECSISCQFERVPVFLYASSQDAAGDIDEELAGCAKAGLTAAARDDAGLPHATGKAMRIERQAQFDPLAYPRGLEGYVLAHGGAICTDVRYQSVAETKGKAVVSTKAGDIEAGHVVLPTHTPPNKLTLQLKLSPHMSYVLALRCRGRFSSGLFYDTEEPYHYLLSHKHKDGELVTVGGADHRTGSSTGSEEAYASLERWARDHLELKEVVVRWSGMVFEPSDGLPYIGLNLGAERTYVITGLSGTGMSAGILGALICTASISGEASPYAARFEPSLIEPMAAAVEFAKHSAAVGQHMVMDRIKGFLNLEPLSVHEGRVLRHEGKLMSGPAVSDLTPLA